MKMHAHLRIAISFGCLCLLVGLSFWLISSRLAASRNAPDSGGGTPLAARQDDARSDVASPIETPSARRTVTRATSNHRESAAGEEGAESALSSAQEGRQLMQAGDHQGAVRTFTQALRLDPDDAALLVGLGISQHRTGQDERAIAALSRALELNPEAQHAHALLGRLYFTGDSLEQSIRHYEAALLEDPNDAAVRDGLYAARRAHQADHALDRLYSPHFVVKFEPVHRRLANDVIDRLERLSSVIGGQLGGASEEPIIVILYSDRRFKEVTDSPAWAGGLYDGKIHLAARSVIPAGQAETALAHEYAHAIVHRLSAGHAPAWLQEGLALYFEGRPAAWSRQVLARHRSRIVPLHALHKNFLGLPSREAQIAYAEGLSAMRAIIEQYDMRRVRRLLDELAVTPEFAVAFETVFQRPYRDFESAWVAGLTSVAHPVGVLHG